jgi:hypothetical protein
MKCSKLTMIMRVSKESTQAETEEAATFYWGQPVEFKSFPSVFDPNVIYWMHTHSEDSPDADELPFPEPDTLDAIPHVATPTFKPLVCAFPRSHSSDDLNILLTDTRNRLRRSNGASTIVLGVSLNLGKCQSSKMGIV